MKIIAFSGKKQSGKTTAVDSLAEKFDGRDKEYFEVNFADALKELVYRYMICPVRNEVNNWGGIYVDSFSKESIKNSTHPCGKTIRELLQIIGTDWFRTLWPDVWICNYREVLKQITRGSIILTTDVRFPNEVKCIQDLGGCVIRLLRAPFPDDKHESETALDMMTVLTCTTYEQAEGSPIEKTEKSPTEIYFDAIIDNRNMDIPTQNKAIWKLVKERNWI